MIAGTALSAAEGVEQQAGGAVVLDLRSAHEFCAGHPAGAINVAFSAKSLAERVDAVVPDAPLLLLAADADQATSAAALLVAAGRTVAGQLSSDEKRWREAGGEWETLMEIEAAALVDPAARPGAVLDVREPIEWDTGHVPGAILIPLGSLRERLEEVPRDREVTVICEAGVRSATAASLLRSAGFGALVNVSDGTAGYRRAGRPLEFPAKEANA